MCVLWQLGTLVAKPIIYVRTVLFLFLMARYYCTQSAIWISSFASFSGWRIMMQHSKGAVCAHAPSPCSLPLFGFFSSQPLFERFFGHIQCSVQWKSELGLWYLTADKDAYCYWATCVVDSGTLQATLILHKHCSALQPELRDPARGSKYTCSYCIQPAVTVATQSTSLAGLWVFQGSGMFLFT